MKLAVLTLILALAGLGLMLFSFWPVPARWPWKLGVIAGEFGHFWLPIGVIVLLAAGWGVLKSEGATRGVAAVAVVVAAMATGLAGRPAAQAARLAKELPPQLDAAWGPAPAGWRGPAVWTWARLWRWGAVPRGPVTTRVFAHAGTPEELAMDVYGARNDGERRPVVMVIHGGGWDGGDRKQVPDFNHHLASLGYVVVAPAYRLAPRHRWPAQRDDVQAALTYLREQGAEWGIDAGRIVLMGRSAGGQLATAVGYRAGDPSIRGVIALYSPHDLNFAWRYVRADDALNSDRLMRQYLGGPAETHRAAYDEASGIRAVRRRSEAVHPTPPTLLMHGSLDTLVWRRQSERLATVLAVNDVPYAFIELPWATHAFEVNLHGPGGQLTDYAVQRFLATVTQKP